MGLYECPVSPHFSPKRIALCRGVLYNKYVYRFSPFDCI